MTVKPDPTLFPLDHLAERGAANGHGEAPALVLRDKVLNHNALRQRVDWLAGWLSSELPKRGARVATWAVKGELTCLMPLAAARAGLVHVPINPLLKRAQVAHILADSGSALLIATPSRLKSLDEGDVPFACATLEEKVALERAFEVKAGHGPSKADPDEVCAILYTSGSTGRPKGVVLSHANLWLGAVAHNTRFETLPGYRIAYPCATIPP